MFKLVDRMGNSIELSHYDGESVQQVLIRNYIPISSVIVLRDEQIVNETTAVYPKQDFRALLIEGYDLEKVRRTYQEFDQSADGEYIKRRLSFNQTGNIELEKAPLSVDEVAQHVEYTLIETCKEYDLVTQNSSVLIGLSGGVDSSSLLIALANARAYLPSFRLVAVTFEDFDSRSSPTFFHAAQLAQEYEVEHHIVSSELAEEVFQLNTKLDDILLKLMATEDAHHVMYIDHHTTRRVLEVFAEKNGLDRIALGLHTTDLVAGLLNGVFTGYNMASLPLRQLENILYIYPLAFIPKKELHIYHYYQTGQFAKHSNPNSWELNPKDRNFYYYLADQLQTYWPSLEIMMFTAHKLKLNRQPALRYEKCQNCGSYLLHQPFTLAEGSLCDACEVFKKHNFIKC